jgi:hypothetical protein
MTADLSSSLEMHLSKEFDASGKTALATNETLPLNLFGKNRGQWKSSNILQ